MENRREPKNILDAYLSINRDNIVEAVKSSGMDESIINEMLAALQADQRLDGRLDSARRRAPEANPSGYVIKHLREQTLGPIMLRHDIDADRGIALLDGIFRAIGGKFFTRYIAWVRSGCPTDDKTENSKPS